MRLLTLTELHHPLPELYTRYIVRVCVDAMCPGRGAATSARNRS